MSTGGTPPALALLQQALGFWISRAIIEAQQGKSFVIQYENVSRDTAAERHYFVGCVEGRLVVGIGPPEALT
jgi:hypothetical protein